MYAVDRLRNTYRRKLITGAESNRTQGFDIHNIRRTADGRQSFAWISTLTITANCGALQEQVLKLQGKNIVSSNYLLFDFIVCWLYTTTEQTLSKCLCVWLNKTESAIAWKFLFSPRLFPSCAPLVRRSSWFERFKSHVHALGQSIEQLYSMHHCILRYRMHTIHFT